MSVPITICHTLGNRDVISLFDIYDICFAVVVFTVRIKLRLRLLSDEQWRDSLLSVGWDLL